MKWTQLLVAGALLATPVLAEKKAFTGIITDTMCGTDHTHMNIAPNAKCVRDCVKLDKKYKYALHDGKNMYILSDQQTPEKYAAQKVRVTGELFEKTGILKVHRIDPIK